MIYLLWTFTERVRSGLLTLKNIGLLEWWSIITVSCVLWRESLSVFKHSWACKSGRKWGVLLEHRPPVGSVYRAYREDCKADKKRLQDAAVMRFKSFMVLCAAVAPRRGTPSE